MSPVCLPWPSQTLEANEQTKGTVLGWGRTTPDKLAANQVKHCIEKLKDRNYYLFSFYFRICSQLKLQLVLCKQWNFLYKRKMFATNIFCY